MSTFRASSPSLIQNKKGESKILRGGIMLRFSGCQTLLSDERPQALNPAFHENLIRLQS